MSTKWDMEVDKEFKNLCDHDSESVGEDGNNKKRKRRKT